MIVRLALTPFEKVMLCTGDKAAIYKLSDISLEYDAILHKDFATMIGEMYAGATSFPYTKVTPNSLPDVI